MQATKRREYRGYRIEVVSEDADEWRLSVYRLSPDLPSPLRPSTVRYRTVSSAFYCGTREIDWLLSNAMGRTERDSLLWKRQLSEKPAALGLGPAVNVNVKDKTELITYQV